MKRRFLLPVLAACAVVIGVSASTAEAGLLGGLLGGPGCCEPACAPACCEPACCEPCCKKPCLLDRIRAKRACTKACCEPACCEPACAPAPCEPACCEPCCKPRLIDRLMARYS